MLYVRTWLCSICAMACSLTLAPAADQSQTLFIIERSKNANVVHYDARLTAEGRLDPKQPVAVYWILLAEDGQREGLNLVERKAYGFDIKPDAAGSAWVMTIAAYRKRTITVRQTAGGVRAEIVIDGRPSVFEKMYINSTEGRMLPTVNYIELFGKDLQTGAKTHEKLLPE